MYTKLTLLDCKQSLADRHDGGTLPVSSTTLAFWTRLINRGVAYCADKLRLTKQASLILSAGTADLPDDFILINNVFDSSSNELVKIDQADKAGQTGNVYWISGDQNNGFQLNAPSDGTYTIQYAYRPAPMSSDSDICVIPDIEAVVAFAYARLRKGESDPFGDAGEALAECDARLREMQSAYAVNSDAIGFSWE